MKILLSAYACEPNKGSEPGVGWNWAIELAKSGHTVHVLTRENNRTSIELEIGNLPVQNRPTFVYFDLPRWLSFWKKGQFGVHQYYFLWQIGAYCLAKKLHKSECFDLVHHVTFVSARQPSFMGLLGIPFIFGPGAGGERAPVALRRGYPFVGKVADALRDIVNWCVRLDPFMHLTFQTATRIYATSIQTQAIIPAIYHHKVLIQLAIGIDSNAIHSEHRPMEATRRPKQLLYVGRLVYLKRLDIALAAFAEYRAKYPDSRFTIVGDGPETGRLKEAAQQMNLLDSIDWQPWLPQEQLDAIYHSHDVMLFPSLRDSGGMVVLEAMARGMPIICFNLGGPGVIVDSSCGKSLSVNEGYTCQQAARDMAEGLFNLAEAPILFTQLRNGAVARARQYTWDTLVKNIYEDYQSSSEKSADLLSKFGSGSV